MAARSEKELGDLLKQQPDTIEIEGDLTATVLRIKATGKVAWAVAIGAIAVAVIALIGTGGTAAPVSTVVATGAVAVLGLSTTTAAIAIAVAGGGVGVLTRLRKYKIVKNDNGRLVLSRR